MIAGSTTGRDPTRESELLERERETGVGAVAARHAAAGSGRLVLLEGPPGIGKSRLLQAIGEIAATAGLHGLSASGGELEGSLAFGVVQDLLGPLVGAGERATGAAALGVAIVGGASGGASAMGDDAAAMNGLRWLVADAAARRPLALLVDDAQWADPSSLRFLAYLARRLEALPVLMVLASRDAPGAEGERVTAQLRRVAGDPLRPSPLSEAAAAALLERALGRATATPFARACATATGGNPLLLHELATELRVQGVAPSAEQASHVRSVGPAGVARAVAARVAGIGEGATALARAVAVLGPSAQPAITAELAGCSLQAASDAVIALAWADVLVDERPLRFTHPVVRTAVYGALGATERSALHRRAAQLLLAAGRSPDEVAAHLLATDPAGDPAVVNALREAGAWAFARGAPDATVGYLRRALEEPPPAGRSPSLRALLGTAELRIGDPRAVGDLHRAVLEAGNAGERAGHALLLGRALMFAGRGREAAGVLGEAADAVPAGDRDAGLRLAGEALFAARLDPSAIDAARARLDRWDRLEGATAAERLALVAIAYTDALRLRCSADRAAQLASRGWDGGTLLAHEGPDSATPYRASATLAIAERFQTAAEVNTAGMEEAQARGSAVGFALASAAQADVELRRGALEDAEAHARTALELTRETGLLAMFLPFLAAPVLQCLLERGELDACERLLERHELGGELREVGGNELVLLVRAHLRIAQGRGEEGVADLREIGRRLEPWGTANPAAVPWRSTLAATLGHRGDVGAARELAATELGLARRWGTPRAIGVALRAAGDIEAGERSVTLLEESVAALEPTPARLEHARSLVSLGAALRRDGRRRAARAPLAHAAEVAEAQGALALAEQAAQELHVAGARPRRVQRTGFASLTASERRIALLARGGATNREIAESLWLSVKTVEMHLRNAYRKLNIASRRELATAIDGAPAPSA